MSASPVLTLLDMPPMPEPEAIHRDVAASRFARERTIAQAVESCDVVIWTMDMNGLITSSEGGGLDAMGVRSGQFVGRNIREWKGIPFDEAMVRLRSGEEHVRYIIEGPADTFAGGSDEKSRRLWSGAWVLSMSHLRSPGGRSIGVSCVAMALTDASATKAFRACPLGACLIEDAHVEVEPGSSRRRRAEDEAGRPGRRG